MMAEEMGDEDEDVVFEVLYINCFQRNCPLTKHY